MVCDAWHIEIICILGIVCSHKLYACELLKKVLFTANYLKRVLSIKLSMKLPETDLNENSK